VERAHVSHLPGLNRGPHPYHGCALPTELRWHFYSVFGHFMLVLNLSMSHASHFMDAAYSSCSGCMIFLYKISTISCNSPPDCLTLPTVAKLTFPFLTNFESKCRSRRQHRNVMIADMIVSRSFVLENSTRRNTYWPRSSNRAKEYPFAFSASISEI
jgi:hypothetical protein